MNEKYLQGYFNTYVAPNKPDATYEDWVSKISTNDAYKQGMFKSNVLVNKPDATYDDWNAKVFGTGSAIESEVAVLEPPVEKKNPVEPTVSTNGSQDLQATQELPSIPSQPLAGLGGGVVKEKAGAEQLGVTHAFSGKAQELADFTQAKRQAEIDSKNYIVNGEPVTRFDVREKLLDRDFMGGLETSVNHITINNDPELEELFQRQVNSFETNDQWDSLLAGTYRLAKGGVGAIDYVNDVMEQVTGDEDWLYKLTTNRNALNTLTKVGNIANLSVTSTLANMAYDAVTEKDPKIAEDAAKLELILSDISKTIKETEEEYSEKRFQIEDDFIDLASKGEFAEMGIMAVNTTIESAPLAAAAMAANYATGGFAGTAAVLFPLTAGMEHVDTQLSTDEKINALSEQDKLIRAGAYGAAEALGESFTGGLANRTWKLSKQAVMKTVKNTAKEYGEEAAKKVAEGAAKETFGKIIKTWGLESLGEGTSEAATSLMQSLIDNYLGISDDDVTTILRRVVNDFALGVASGQIMSSPQLVTETGGRLLDRRIVEGDGSINDLKEAAKGYSKKTGIPVDDIEAGIDSRAKAVNAVPADKVEDTKTVDLVQEKQKLQEELSQLDDAFKAPIQEKIDKIDAELTGKPVDAAKKDKVPDKKKSSIEEFVDINKQIDEIYKEELTPERDKKSDKLYADSYTAREKVFEEHATPEQKAEEKGIKDEEAKYDYKAKVVSEIVEKSKNETKTEPTKKKGRLTKFSSGDIFGEVVYEDGTRKDLTKDEYNDLAKEEGVFDVEETAPVDKRQQELDDAIAKADAEVAALRDADGSVSDENTVAFKAAVKRRSELQSQGEENKGEFSFREKAEVGKDRARYLTEEETKKADAIIQAIIDSGLKNGLSAEEISDQIINRHSFILTEVQAIKQYVAGLVNNATEQGNSKQSFSAWRQGKMDSDIKQSSKETPIEIKSPKEFLDDMEIDGEPPMLRAENPIDDVKAILDTYKSMLKDGSYGEGRKEELVKRIEETEAVIAKATEKPVAEKPKKEKTQTAPPKEETAPTVVKSAETVLSKLKSNAEQRKAERENNAKNETDSEERGFQERMAKHDQEEIDAIEKDPVSYLEKQIKTLQEWVDQKDPFLGGEDTVRDIQEYKDALAELTGTKEAPREETRATEKKIPEQTVAEKETIEPKTERAKKPSESKTTEAPIVVSEGKVKQEDYRGAHTAPRKEGLNTLDNPTDMFGDDIYSPQAARYFGHGDKAMDDASARKIQSFKGKPDAEVTIYRAVPKGVKDINAGDWVTINKKYAKEHGEAHIDGEFDIIEKKVKAKDLATDANSIHEWGYSPEETSQSNKQTPATPTKEVKSEKVSESETNKETASEADVIKDPIVKRAAKGFLKIGTKVLSNAKALQDFVNELTGKGVQTRLDQAPFQTRDGKRIGFNYDTEQVARERFDFSNLKEIGKGSDRTVFDLGDGKVLKVAHTARGLEQNVFEGDYYLADAGIMPEFFERGLNYIVMEKVDPVIKKTIRLGELADIDITNEKANEEGVSSLKAMLSDLKTFTQNDFDRKTAKLQDVLEKHGLSDIMNYDVLWGDFIAKRNWGIKNGKPIHLDGGTFGGVQMITSHRGKAPLSDPEFRDIYEKSRRVKKEMGDTDKYTRFNITMPDGSKKEVQPSSPEVVNGFYSPLEKIISESKQDKMPAVQWAKKFAVGEEAKWTGLTEWLGAQEGSVTKAEIQEFLKDNRIEVVEVVKGDSYDPNDINSLSQEMFGVNFNDMTTEQKAKHREESDRRVEKRETPKGVPKYSDQQLEGEKTDYKEVLVTMPNKGIPEGYEVNKITLDNGDVIYRANGDGISSPHKTHDEAKAELEKRAKELYGAGKLGGAKYKSTHWDEPNILVHVRMNTRTDADGKKVLFLEEVQSDWGQEGKKKGFAENKQNYALGEKRIKNGKEEFPVLDQNGSEYGVYGRLEDAQRRVDYDNKQLSLGSRDTPNARTPKAPFVTDTNAWVKLGLKVALKEAQKQGVDRIAWTTGEQQNERYDLSKQVDYIVKEKGLDEGADYVDISTTNSMINVEVDNKTGEILMQTGDTRAGDFVGKNLSDVIGKEMSQKILDAEYSTKLEGDDLKVGGKGMKGFYGSPTEGSLGIVGNVAKKLFKQTPKTTEIKTRGGGEYDAVKTKSDVDKYLDRGDKLTYNGEPVTSKERAYQIISRSGILEGWSKSDATQHSIDLTPELKAEAQEGQPLFHYNEKGEILGVSYKDPVTGKNKMALNGEKITAKTTFEEMGHTWINWAKDVRPDLHEAGLKKVGGSKYLKEVMADKNYQAEALKQGKKGSAEYNAYMAEEALAKAIADNGAKFVTGAKKASFQEWVMSMWRAVAEQFGIQSLTPKEIGKLTLDEFSKKAAADVFAKERTAEKVSESESNKVDVKKIEDEIAQLRKDRDAYLEDFEIEKAREADNRIVELSSQLDTEIEQREFTEEEKSEAFDDRKKKAEEDPESRDYKTGIIHDQFTGLNESDLVAMGWDVRSMKEDRKLYSGLIDFTEKGKKAKTKIEDMAAEMSESAGVEITTDDIRRYIQDIAREKNLGIDTYGKRRVGKGVKKETTTQKKERLKQERDSLWNEIGEDLNKSGFAKTPENEAASADKLLSDLMKLAKYELKISQLSAKEFIEKAIAHYGPTIKSVAAKAHKLAKMSFGATFEEYNEAIKEAKKDAAKALKEAVKEARRIESEKFKAKFEKFKAELKNKQAKAKGMATAVSEAKKEMRKAVRESELDFTKQQASKLMGIISEVTAKNFEKKIDSVNEYIDSLKEKQEQKEINNLKKALLKKMASSTHLYKSDGKKRKRIAISPEAQSELATLRREYKDQIKHMDNEAILALNELVDGIIETGKANQKDNIKARKAIRRSQKEQGTKLFSEKTAESIPLEGGKDAAMKELRKPTGELGGGNAILVGNTILLPDATGRKMAESMSESDFDNAVLIKIPPKGMIESASLLDQLKGFVMSKTDMRTISSLLMSDKASQEWWEDNLINPMIRASNAVFTDRMNLSQAFKSNREKAFDGRKKANKALKGKSGIHLKTSDGNTIIKDMTNDQVAYIYMAMLDPRNISKMFNGKMTSENLIEIANYVNSNPKLKSYAEGIINVYDSYLPTTNKALGEAGYQIIEPHNSADFKNQLLEGTGEALKEKKAILTSEIADLKEELKTTKTPESVEKKIAAKEKALEKLIETGESLEKAKRIYEAIYGDIENMPDVTPYAPSSVNQSEKDIATPDVQDMFTSKAHAPSVLSNNMIEKKSGGEFNPIMNAEAAFIRYAESMTNAANKIALYESVFSMLPKGGTIMKLMEQKYGSRVTQEMQQLMQNIVMEKNMQSKSAPNFISNWINRSQGTALFLNWKAAAFQTISGPNFLAEAIIKEGLGGEYFKNSNPFSEKNREALKEITESGWFIERMNKSFIPEMKDLSRKDSKGRIGWLDDVLTKGFYPNKFVDSKITIAYFGAPLYVSLKGKYYKENLKTMPKAEAMADAQTRAMDKFSDYVNKSQQSAVQMYRSTEQNDTFKRALLTFGSVSLLYTRESIRTVADMKNGRTSLLKGMANIAYYQGMQNAIFFSLQEGILFTAGGLVNMMMGSDDDEDKKAALKQSTRIVNQSANSILRGFGAYGASFAVVKDIGIDVFLRYAPREKHDEIEKNYNLIIDSLPDKKMKLRIASDALGQAVPTLGIKLRRLEKTFSLLDKSQNVDPNASSAEYIINKYIAPTASVAELANIPTSNIMRQIEAINDVSKDDMAIHEAFFRLIEVLPDYIHEDNKELNKVLSAEESRKKEKKESSEEKEASKQVAIEAIAAKSKTPYSESIRSSSVPYQQAKEYKDIANESRKTKISIEAAKSEIAEQYNVEVLKNTVEDNMLLDAFITSDGEGTTLRTKDIIASKYVDNVIEVKKNNLTEYALTKDHEEILKNALKHMDVMKRSALIRSINKEIATYKDREK